MRWNSSLHCTVPVATSHSHRPTCASASPSCSRASDFAEHLLGESLLGDVERDGDRAARRAVRRRTPDAATATPGPASRAVVRASSPSVEAVAAGHRRATAPNDCAAPSLGNSTGARRPSDVSSSVPDMRSAARFHITMRPPASTRTSRRSRRRRASRASRAVPRAWRVPALESCPGRLPLVRRPQRTARHCRPPTGHGRRRARISPARSLMLARRVRGRRDHVVPGARLARARAPRRGRVRAPGDHGQAARCPRSRSSTTTRWHSCGSRRRPVDVLVVVGRDARGAPRAAGAGADLGAGQRLARLWRAARHPAAPIT